MSHCHSLASPRILCGNPKWERTNLLPVCRASKGCCCCCCCSYGGLCWWCGASRNRSAYGRGPREMNNPDSRAFGTKSQRGNGSCRNLTAGLYSVYPHSPHHLPHPRQLTAASIHRRLCLDANSKASEGGGGWGGWIACVPVRCCQAANALVVVDQLIWPMASEGDNAFVQLRCPPLSDRPSDYWKLAGAD